MTHQPDTQVPFLRSCKNLPQFNCVNQAPPLTGRRLHADLLTRNEKSLGASVGLRLSIRGCLLLSYMGHRHSLNWTPLARGSKPGGHVVLSSAIVSRRSASSRSAPRRSASLRSAPLKLAPRRTTPPRLALRRSALRRSAASKLASSRLAPAISAPERSDLDRSSCAKFVPARLAPCSTMPDKLRPACPIPPTQRASSSSGSFGIASQFNARTRTEPEGARSD
jgi:hypothetical protein